MREWEVLGYVYLPILMKFLYRPLYILDHPVDWILFVRSVRSIHGSLCALYILSHYIYSCTIYSRTIYTRTIYTRTIYTHSVYPVIALCIYTLYIYSLYILSYCIYTLYIYSIEYQCVTLTN